MLSLQMARERARQAKGASDRQISKRSDPRLLERLEAENAQLRARVVELMLEIRALRDGAKYCRNLRLRPPRPIHAFLVAISPGHRARLMLPSGVLSGSECLVKSKYNDSLTSCPSRDFGSRVSRATTRGCELRNLQWLVPTGRLCVFPQYFARVSNRQLFPL